MTFYTGLVGLAIVALGVIVGHGFPAVREVARLVAVAIASPFLLITIIWMISPQRAKAAWEDSRKDVEPTQRKN